MREYEVVVLLHPDLEIDMDKPLAKLRKIIADNKGEITKEDVWGKRKLAYRIKKEDFAVYVYMEANLVPGSLKKISDTLNITDEVLRYLITEVDPLSRVEEERKAELAKES